MFRSDAIVVCKSLGFPSGNSTKKSLFGKEGSDFIMDDVKCQGKLKHNADKANTLWY